VNRYTVKIQRLDKDSDPLGDPIIRPDTMSESPSDAAKWACDQMLQSSHIPDHWDIEDEKSAGSVWFFVTDQCVSVEVFFCGIVEETKKTGFQKMRGQINYTANTLMMLVILVSLIMDVILHDWSICIAKLGLLYILWEMTRIG